MATENIAPTPGFPERTGAVYERKMSADLVTKAYGTKIPQRRGTSQEDSKYGDN